MKQVMPKKLPDLLTRAQDAAKAAATIGPVIGLVRNTDAAINPRITALRAAMKRYNSAVTTLSTQRAEVRAITLSGRDYMRVTREVLKIDLGRKHSVAWVDTGFAKSLVLPRLPEQMQPRLQSMQSYLEAHPDYQVERLNATAARGAALFNSLSAARAAVNEQLANVKTLLKARRAAEADLRGCLRGLVAELKQSIGPRDPRWWQFGFNMPGADETPEAPENVAVVSQVAGEIEVAWPPTPRAESYHVRERVVTPEGETLVLIGSPNDPQFKKTGLTSGTRMELCVSALNTGGESPRSEFVTVVVT